MAISAGNVTSSHHCHYAQSKRMTPAHLEAVTLVLHNVGALAILRRQHLQRIDDLVHLALGLLVAAAHCGWRLLTRDGGGLPLGGCGGKRRRQAAVPSSSGGGDVCGLISLQVRRSSY